MLEWGRRASFFCYRAATSRFKWSSDGKLAHFLTRCAKGSGFIPAEAEMTRPTYHIYPSNYHSMHTSPPRAKWEPLIPDKHHVLAALFWFRQYNRLSFIRLAIKWYYGCMSKSCRWELSLHRGVFDPATFHHSAGKKWDGIMMNVVDFTLMSSRMSTAVPFPRCGAWWYLFCV